MKLPEVFIDRMTEFFNSSSVKEEGFWESFDKEPLNGIRLNRAKTTEENYSSVLADLNNDNKKVLWCDSGFYTNMENPGKDPYYHAGVYYPQEPSAMLPAQVLNAKPGDIVLDLCAAPGGKACRIGEDLRGEGLLIANEINYDRSKALLRNIERTGIKNSVILNETPENIADKLPSFFDKVLIDAPCSGEGMFRRDPQATKSWERFGPSTCIPIQSDILESSYIVLKPGGDMVYSTCTFCIDEDENMIIEFLKKHPDMKIVSHPEISGVTHNNDILPGSMRIWPHLSEGDGHFCVHMKKDGELIPGMVDPRPEPKYRKKKEGIYTFNKSLEVMLQFFKDIYKEESFESLKADTKNKITMHGNGIYQIPVNENYLKGLKTVKTGWFPGEIKQTSYEKIFVPSNSLALTLNKNDIKENSVISISRDDERITRYLKGETLFVSEEELSKLKKKGIVVICVKDYPLGLGKLDNGTIKNMYPKAWRLI